MSADKVIAPMGGDGSVLVPTSLAGGNQTISSAGLTWRLATSFQELEEIEEEWDTGVLELGGSMYMSFSWLRTWWEFYGRGRDLRLFMFRDESGIAGLIPIYIDSLGIFPFKLKVARLVGSSLPPKAFNPPVFGKRGREIWQVVIKTLFSVDGCDLITIGPCSEKHPGFKELSEAALLEKELCDDQVEQVQKDVQTVYHFPATFDEYFESIPAKEKKIRVRKLRELNEAYNVRVEVVNGEKETREEFERFAEAHTRQWNAENRPGHFHAWPRGLEYNRAQVEAQSKRGRVLFFQLWANDKLIANQYTFGFGDTLYAELPTRAFEPEWEKFSLGCTSQVKLIESAINGGFRQMDSGLGQYPYKVLLNGVEGKVLATRVLRRSPSGRIRYKLFKLYSNLLNIALRKVWYRRIMPRLPEGWRSGQSEMAINLEI
jgi:hypothetical protein